MYQTILYKYSSKDDFIKLHKNIFSKIEDTGSLFVFFGNEYDKNGNIKKSIFDVINKFLKFDLEFVNTIVYPVEDQSKNEIKRNISYVIWFVKNSNKMIFNKDLIREKHIWKDVEWGKREKNYNPKGKDPGNVWIPTIDNGKGAIISHTIMSKEDVINRCILISLKKKSLIYLSIPGVIKSNIIHKENIIFSKSSFKQTFVKENNNYFSYKKNSLNTDVKCSGDVYFFSSEKMAQIKNNSVDLMVTSPPYWDLKNYFKEGQIGQESYQEYLKRINRVWEESYRVLKDNSSAWININIRTKNKKPIFIPDDIINQCKKIGFRLRDVVIWHKSSGIPTHKKNIVDRYEFFLWFTKGSVSKINKIEINDYKNSGINQGLLWNINRKAGSVGKNYIHPAIYPNELIDRVIKLCTTEGGVVLDPFLGSGTTLISALNNSRNCIGYEFNENFIELIKHRLIKDLKIDKFNIKFHGKNIDNKNKIFRDNIN